MRVLVLGAGALGGYFGGKLLKAGAADVEFLVRPRRADQLKARGLSIREPAGEFTLPVKTVQAGELKGAYDLVLLACKAYDLEVAMDAIAPAVGPQTAILPVLNGMAHIETLSARFGAGTTLGGMTVVYAAMTPDGNIERGAMPFDGTNFGELTGQRSARCEAILAALTAAGIAANVSDNIGADMWRKFAGFVLMAMITTLVRARAGEIAAASAGAGYVAAALAEVARVMTKEGYTLLAEDEATVHGMYTNPNSTYAPSIFRDMENGLRTEAEHTIGDMVRRAERHGVEVPLCRAALCQLQICEQRRQRAAAAA